MEASRGAVVAAVGCQTWGARPADDRQSRVAPVWLRLPTGLGKTATKKSQCELRLHAVPQSLAASAGLQVESRMGDGISSRAQEMRVQEDGRASIVELADAEARTDVLDMVSESYVSVLQSMEGSGLDASADSAGVALEAAMPRAAASAPRLSEVASTRGLDGKAKAQQSPKWRPATKYGDSRTLLSDARKKRQLQRMLEDGERDLAGALHKEVPKDRQWPFWRKRRTKDGDGLSPRQLTHRIVQLQKRKQLPLILALLDDAKAQGKQLNVITMNAAMAACIHCNDIEMALDLFDEMIEPGGCGADSITYGTLLKGLGRARRLDDAFELLESMEAGTAPGRPELTEVHLNTLVNACADAGDARRARSVLTRFKAYGRGMGPSVFTYNLLIKGYARSDNPLEALKVVDEMQLQGLPLERVSYNSLILACIRGGELERALDYLQEMKAEAWKRRDPTLWPDRVTYTTVLKGLAEDGDLEGVLSLVNDMKHGVASLEGLSLEPGIDFDLTAIASGASQDQAFIEAASAACTLDRVAYSAVIDACLMVGSTADALVLLREMDEKAHTNPAMRPRAHVFLSLMRALAARGFLEQAREVNARLVKDAAGRVWPEELWEADELILEACVLSGRILEAEEQFQVMLNRLEDGDSSGFSERGFEAVVRLSASSQLPAVGLEPISIKAEVRLRAPIEAAMLPLAQVKSLSPDATSADLEAILRTGQALVPVLDWRQRCVGVLTAHHLQNWGELAQPSTGLLNLDYLHAPPTASRFAPVGDVAALLVSKRAPLVAITYGESRISAGLVKERLDPQAENAIVGFVLREMLF